MDEATFVADLEGMREVLAGSPYSAPDEVDDLSTLLLSVMSIKTESKQLWIDLGAALKTDDKGVVGILEERWRIPATHHSNRLEFEGPIDIAVTERIAKKFEPSVADEFLSVLTLLDGLMGDDRLVVGHDAAFRYARLIAHEAREQRFADEIREPKVSEDFNQEPRNEGHLVAEVDIRNFNRILEFGKTYSTGEQPGEYARHERYITREVHKVREDQLTNWEHFDDSHLYKRMVSPDQIPGQVQDLCKWLNSRADRTEEWGGLIATVAHAWLTYIHPFSDGNGRTARLLANLVLAHGTWPPLVIKSSTDRPRYIDALDLSDSTSAIFPLYELFWEVLNRKLNDLLVTPEFAPAQLQFHLTQDRAKSFNSWLAVLRMFIRELEAKLAVEMRVQREAEPDFHDFELANQRKQAPRIWALRLFKHDGSPIGLVWLGFCSSAMNRVLEEGGEVTPPSLFFDLDKGFRHHLDTSGKNYEHWRSASDATEGVFPIEEINLCFPEEVPSATEGLDANIRYFNRYEFEEGQHNRFRRGTEADVVVADMRTAVETLAKALLDLVKPSSTIA